jgi:hypothetical protein
VSVADSKSELGEAFLVVWRQALAERAQEVTLGEKHYAIRRTAKRGLAQVDFEIVGIPYRALEQNPETKSRWAQLARKGAKVMQFLSEGRYVTVVVDGKVTHYNRAKA